MYETHFGFHRQPFQSADATRAFFVSESIHAILPQLLHALRTDLGIAVVTGPPGSGKTALLRHVQQQLALEGRAIICSAAGITTSADLTAVLLEASRMKAGTNGIDTAVRTSPTVSTGSRSFALEEMKRTAELWGPVLLLIDDAQFMTLPILNELRSYTEEEWNGRGLVHCLISAPISFEEQLARSEYAEFGRRIRCHAFLQPLKSDESMRLLQEQIELAGGKLSNVFTAAALELIISAANGTPRCLSLLADESLVVAAEAKESKATEQSVRTALGRLQHLQYNWNASPLSPSAEEISGDDVDESALTDTSHAPKTEVVAADDHRDLPTPKSIPVRIDHSPVHATLAPGVVEFGGPANRVAPPVIPPSVAASSSDPSELAAPILSNTTVALETAAPVTAAPVTAAPETAAPVISEQEISHEEQERAEVPTPQLNSPAVRIVEFGISTPDPKATSAFEVGHRFADESPKDSISLEEVDDQEIMDLFGYGSHTATEAIELPLHSHDDGNRIASNHVAGPALDLDRDELSADDKLPSPITWINGNFDESDSDDLATIDLEEFDPLYTMESNESDVAELADDETTNSLLNAEMSVAEIPLAADNETAIRESVFSEFKRVDPIVSEAPTPLATQFRIIMNSGLSNRLPVFDRYTWIGLGRDVPPGTSPIASLTRNRSLMLTDYGLVALNQRRDLSLTSAPAFEKYSLDEIPVTVTTDACLMSEFTSNSSRSETGAFLVTQDITVLLSESLTQRENFDSPMADVENSPSTSPGLKLWRDGQLIFSAADEEHSPEGSDSESESNSLGLDANSLPNKSNDPQRHAPETPANSKIQNAPEIQPEANDFYTLGATALRFDTLPLSPSSEVDSEVSPIVDSVAGLRSDMQHFQSGAGRSGYKPSGGQGSTTESQPQGESDSLISRAERRLRTESSVEFASVTGRPMLSGSRDDKFEYAENRDSETQVLSGTGTKTPQFSRLFTRLWQNRQLAADASENKE